MLRLSTYVVKGRLSRAFPHTCRASSPQSHPIPSHCLTSQVCLFSLPSLTPILCLSIHLFALPPASSPLTLVIKPVRPCSRPSRVTAEGSLVGHPVKFYPLPGVFLTLPSAPKPSGQRSPVITLVSLPNHHTPFIPLLFPQISTTEPQHTQMHTFLLLPM